VSLSAQEILELLDEGEYLASGFVVPRRFPAHVEGPGGESVDFTVVVEDGRARATELAVRSKAGIEWQTLGSLPVRNLVATACWAAMWRTKVESGKSSLVQALDRSPELLDVLRDLVGYKVESRLLEPVFPS
jgi:hypothetical protein